MSRPVNRRPNPSPTVVRATTTALALLTVALLVAGCGIPTDARPRALAPSGLPAGLLSPNPPTSSPPPSTTPPTPNQVLVHVYLLGPNGYLVPVNRLMSLPLGSGLDAVLNALFQGPTTAERAAGLQSAIPSQTKVLSTSVAGGVATINLNATLNQLVGPAQIQALAQVVYTATAQHGVGAVEFQFAGQPAEVPVSSGPPAAIVGPAQYATLAPEAAPSNSGPSLRPKPTG